MCKQSRVNRRVVIVEKPSAAAAAAAQKALGGPCYFFKSFSYFFSVWLSSSS